MANKLYKIRKGKIFAGVCGGIAKYLNMDTKIVRLVFAIFVAVYANGLLAYIIFAIFIPKELKN